SNQEHHSFPTRRSSDLKRNIIRFTITAFLLLCVLWMAVPKVYIHNALGHEHSTTKNSGETGIQKESISDCDFDKYNTPVYFTILDRKSTRLNSSHLGIS